MKDIFKNMFLNMRAQKSYLNKWYFVFQYYYFTRLNL
jgi:hypothetical protein